jgi:hypothetical protein
MFYYCGLAAALRTLLGQAASALDFLRAYGFPAYPLELGPGKQKWDARARQGKLLGNDADGQLYRVLLADGRTVKVTKHVRFRERAAGSMQPPDQV